MTENTGAADEARHGLLGKIAGKAKEVTGAVTGNDSLTTEGRLQQAEVENRKDATTADAIATAERTEATHEIAEKAGVAAAQKQAASAQAETEQAAAQREKAVETAAAEQAAARRAAGDKAVADVEAEQKKREADADLREDLTAAAGDKAEAERQHAADTAKAKHAQQAAAKAKAEADALAG